MNKHIKKMIFNWLKRATKKECAEFVNEINNEFGARMKADDLFEQAKDLYNRPQKDYEYIIDKLYQAINISEQQEYYDFLEKVEKEYNSQNKQAEELHDDNTPNTSGAETLSEQTITEDEKLYQTAYNLFFNNEEKDCEYIMDLLFKAIDLNDKQDYRDLLELVEEERDKRFDEALKLYQQARSQYNKQDKNYPQILKLTYQAIKLYNSQEYTKFAHIVETEHEDFQRAKELFKQAKDLFSIQGEKNHTQILYLTNKAIALDNRLEYENFKNEVILDMYRIDSQQAKELFKQAKDLYSMQGQKDYTQILNRTDEAINLENKSEYKKFNTEAIEEYRKFRNKVVAEYERIREAEKIYQYAKAEFNKPQKIYKDIIASLDEALSLHELPENRNFLNKVKNEYEMEKKRVADIYQQAKNLYNKEFKDYVRILKLMKEVIFIHDKQEYIDFRDKVAAERQKYEKADKHFQEAKDLYRKPNRNYEKIIDLAEKANHIIENRICTDFCERMKKEFTQKSYFAAKRELCARNYGAALAYINNALKYNPYNKEYIMLQQQAETMKNKTNAYKNVAMHEKTHYI